MSSDTNFAIGHFRVLRTPLADNRSPAEGNPQNEAVKGAAAGALNNTNPPSKNGSSESRESSSMGDGWLPRSKFTRGTNLMWGAAGKAREASKAVKSVTGPVIAESASDNNLKKTEANGNATKVQNTPSTNKPFGLSARSWVLVTAGSIGTAAGVATATQATILAIGATIGSGGWVLVALAVGAAIATIFVGIALVLEWALEPSTTLKGRELEVLTAAELNAVATLDTKREAGLAVLAATKELEMAKMGLASAIEPAELEHAKACIARDQAETVVAEKTVQLKSFEEHKDNAFAPPGLVGGLQDAVTEARNELAAAEKRVGETYQNISARCDAAESLVAKKAAQLANAEENLATATRAAKTAAEQVLVTANKHVVSLVKAGEYEEAGKFTAALAKRAGTEMNEGQCDALKGEAKVAEALHSIHEEGKKKLELAYQAALLEAQLKEKEYEQARVACDDLREEGQAQAKVFVKAFNGLSDLSSKSTPHEINQNRLRFEMQSGGLVIAQQRYFAAEQAFDAAKKALEVANQTKEGADAANCAEDVPLEAVAAAKTRADSAYKNFLLGSVEESLNRPAQTQSGAVEEMDQRVGVVGRRSSVAGTGRQNSSFSQASRVSSMPSEDLDDGNARAMSVEDHLALVRQRRAEYAQTPEPTLEHHKNKAQERKVLAIPEAEKRLIEARAALVGAKNALEILRSVNVVGTIDPARLRAADAFVKECKEKFSAATAADREAREAGAPVASAGASGPSEQQLKRGLETITDEYISARQELDDSRKLLDRCLAKMRARKMELEGQGVSVSDALVKVNNELGGERESLTKEYTQKEVELRAVKAKMILTREKMFRQNINPGALPFGFDA